MYMPHGKTPPPTPLELAIVRGIRDVMDDQGVTITETADAAGMSVAQLSRVLAGQKSLKLGEMIGLCRALRLSPSTVIALAQAQVG